MYVITKRLRSYEVIARCMGLYEGEIEHINDPTHPCPTKWVFTNSKVKDVKVSFVLCMRTCYAHTINNELLLLTAGNNSTLNQNPP